MFGMQTSNDYQPLTWWKRFPIYATTIYVALTVVGMFATVIGASARVPVEIFLFNPIPFTHGALWQPVTATFVSYASFFFLFGAFCLYSWGVEVERYLGRSRYLQVLGTFILLPDVVSLAWYYLLGVPSSFGGSYLVMVGLFIAFATLYPNLEMFNWIPLKWLAFAGIVVSIMFYLPNHDWPGLSMLLVQCAAGFAIIRIIQRGGIGEFTQWIPKPKPKFRVVRAEDLENSSTNDIQESIDPLLDKIAKHGINSLTAKERARLEKASKELSKKR